MTMLTVFGLLLVCLKAYFNLYRGDRRNLIRTIRTHAHIGYQVDQDRIKEKGFVPCARGVRSLP